MHALFKNSQLGSKVLPTFTTIDIQESFHTKTLHDIILCQNVLL